MAEKIERKFEQGDWVQVTFDDFSAVGCIDKVDGRAVYAPYRIVFEDGGVPMWCREDELDMLKSIDHPKPAKPPVATFDANVMGIDFAKEGTDDATVVSLVLHCDKTDALGDMARGGVFHFIVKEL